VSDPKPIASIESHNRIIALLEDEPRGRLLDVPSGRGALGVRLARMGFDVSYCDIDPALFEVEGQEPAVVNLNIDHLPYPDGHFNYIASGNGLHRLFNIRNAVSEFSRCLAEDGKLFISIPNYASLWRRIMFLLYGSLGRGIDRPTYMQVTEDPEAHFRCALTVARILNTLEECGFHDVRLHSGKAETLNWLALPLVLPIKMMSSFTPRRAATRYRLKEMNSHHVLFGSREVLICAARFHG